MMSATTKLSVVRVKIIQVGLHKGFNSMLNSRSGILSCVRELDAATRSSFQGRWLARKLLQHHI